MNTKPFDREKICRTRDGRRVHHLYAFPKGMLTGFAGEDRYPSFWTADGRFGSFDHETPRDLVNEIEHHVRFANVYGNTANANLYMTEEAADAVAGRSRINGKAFKIEWDE